MHRRAVSHVADVAQARVAAQELALAVRHFAQAGAVAAGNGCPAKPPHVSPHAVSQLAAMHALTALTALPVAGYSIAHFDQHAGSPLHPATHAW
jgi:hypothetical protein